MVIAHNPRLTKLRPIAIVVLILLVLLAASGCDVTHGNKDPRRGWAPTTTDQVVKTCDGFDLIYGRVAPAASHPRPFAVDPDSPECGFR